METPIQSSKVQTGQISDTVLISRIKSSSGAELRNLQNIFYKKYSGYLYKVASQKCRNFSDPQQLAKDIVQETFIIAFNKLPEFDFPASSPEIDHPIVLKGWLGKIANNRFRKIYKAHITNIVDETDLRSRDETLCPMCGEFLVEEEEKSGKNMLICPEKHYKTSKEKLIPAEAGEDSTYISDLFKSLYETSDVEIPNEFRTKLQEAMNTLTEKQRHILLIYANDGCLNSKRHISENSLQELCSTYNTTSDNIKHIKNRAYKKVLLICFPTPN